MHAEAVIGLGFGDEGKGRVVAHLCSQYKRPLVIRYCGGHQAGHHVFFGMKDHVFSNFGSGSLIGARTYWSPYCTVDPQGIIVEREILIGKGVDPVLFLDELCPITTFYDKQANLSNASNMRHGTCGVGFGQTWQREGDGHSLVVGDLLYPKVFQEKVNLIASYYGNPEVRPTESASFFSCCKRMLECNMIQITRGSPQANFQRYDAFIFEGSQGLLLDQNIGLFPHVTRSNTGSKNILKMVDDFHVNLVTRAYQTRHGNGPMTNEGLTDYPIEDNPYEILENPFPGEFRKSLLDLNLLEYAVSKDEYIRDSSDVSLYITCMDVLGEPLRATKGDEVIEYENPFAFITDVASAAGAVETHMGYSPMGGFI